MAEFRPEELLTRPFSTPLLLDGHHPAASDVLWTERPAGRREACQAAGTAAAGMRLPWLKPGGLIVFSNCSADPLGGRGGRRPRRRRRRMRTGADRRQPMAGAQRRSPRLESYRTTPAMLPTGTALRRWPRWLLCRRAAPCGPEGAHHRLFCCDN
ncbi:hypothetical protein F2981_05730 [Sinorhizobium meliloti]|nr:hypothetical protein [Sinorhizobium meliloti]